MILCFELSMPNVGSWNGKWSGASRYYAVTRTVPTEPGLRVLSRNLYHYSWGDGWGANVKVRRVTSAEARFIRKRSDGFCGYEWMVDSIITHGKIYADHQVPEATSTKTEQAK